MKKPSRARRDAAKAPSSTATPRAERADEDAALALVDAMHTFFAGYKGWLRSRLPEGEKNPLRPLVLVFLRRMGPITMGTLAARIARPKSNVTLLVDELEQEGLVTRKPHPSDRRATLIALTAAGRRAALKHGATYDHEVARLFETLPPSDRAHLLATLRALTAFLRTHAPSEEEPPSG